MVYELLRTRTALADCRWKQAPPLPWRISSGRSKRSHNNGDRSSIRLMSSDFRDRALIQTLSRVELADSIREPRSDAADETRQTTGTLPQGGIAGCDGRGRRDRAPTSGHAADACASLQGPQDRRHDDHRGGERAGGIVHRAQFEELRQSAGLLPGDSHPIARA